MLEQQTRSPMRGQTTAKRKSDQKGKDNEARFYKLVMDNRSKWPQQLHNFRPGTEEEDVHLATDFVFESSCGLIRIQVKSTTKALRNSRSKMRKRPILAHLMPKFIFIAVSNQWTNERIFRELLRRITEKFPSIHLEGSSV